MKVIIADTSCLIVYSKIEKLEILQTTFSEITVTREVAEEYGELPDWINVTVISDKNRFSELAGELGPGEASSIALALEVPGSLLIMDEKKGRQIARELEIEIIGSLGVLLKAKEKGTIQSVKEILELIEVTDFRISKSVKEQILKESGE